MLHEVHGENMHHDGIYLPAEVVGDGGVTESWDVKNLPLGFTFVRINISWKLNVDSCNVVSIPSTLTGLAATWGCSGVVVALVVAGEVGGEDLVDEGRLAASGPGGSEETHGNDGLAGFHEVCKMIEELRQLGFILAHKKRNGVDARVTLKDEGLDVFLWLKQHHIEQVLSGDPQLVGDLLRLELLHDEVD